MIQLLYPEQKLVSGETLLSWASDAFVNGDIMEEATDVSDAITLLEDAGLITVAK